MNKTPQRRARSQQLLAGTRTDTPQARAVAVCGGETHETRQKQQTSKKAVEEEEEKKKEEGEEKRKDEQEEEEKKEEEKIHGQF